MERYEDGKEEAPKALLESIARRWNAEYEWLAAETGPKWRRFGRGSSSSIVPTIQALMPSLQDHGPFASLFRTLEDGAPMLRFVLSVSQGEKYYVFAAEASPMGGHSSGHLVDALCELRDEWQVLIEGRDLSLADYRELGEGNLYAGQARSRALRGVHFDPLGTSVENDSYARLHRIQRHEELVKLRLSPDYRQEMAERRRADADLLIHDLESKLRYVDRLEDVQELLKVIARQVKEIQERTPLKLTKGD